MRMQIASILTIFALVGACYSLAWIGLLCFQSKIKTKRGPYG